jgi:predicted phage terminase large subunit-like protein
MATVTAAEVAATPDGLRSEIARRSHLAFMQRCWNRNNRFIVGRHTRIICKEIDSAMERYARGLSTFLIVTVPVRHGKSEIISCHLPPHWVGRFHETDVILVTYGQNLADLLSRQARQIIESPKYQSTYPGVHLSSESASVSNWATTAGGRVSAIGFGGAITGKGYSLGIVDDYCKNREDAESVLIRDKVWEGFTNDFLTRRAPVSVTIVLATRWHTDDLIGRIITHMKDDENFPQFKVVRFAAWDDDSDGKRTFLFPERFDETYYREQEAALGTYGVASLLMNNPRPREGNILKTDRVHLIKPDELADGLRWVRAWDLASTEKQVIRQDPDWTVGVLMAAKLVSGYGGMARWKLYVKDVVRGRWEAPKRDRRIVQTAQLDGPAVTVCAEAVAGYKDTYTRLKAVLQGVRVVTKVVPVKDLVLRAGAVAPTFEAGEVYFVQGDWNAATLAVLGDFPSGAHDDDVAALTAGWEYATGQNKTVGLFTHLRQTNQMPVGTRGPIPDERFHIRMPTRGP